MAGLLNFLKLSNVGLKLFHTKLDCLEAVIVVALEDEKALIDVDI